MHALKHYLADCLTEKSLVPSPIDGLYWSSAIPQKLEAASRTRARFLTLGLGDFLVGTYARMKTARRAIEAWSPGCWSGTEIHHIVENYHLQFLGVVQSISEATYENEEPCVLMAKKHHDTHVDNIVGGAERLVLEARPFDFVAAFRDQHPGISKQNLNRQALPRAAWVKAQERLTVPPVRRQEIRNVLLEIYSFAYQEPELRPLRLIARRVIDGMPL